MRTNQTVLQAKRLGVYSITQDKCLRDAAQRMVEEDISTLVVVDNQGYLQGVLTRTDLLRAFSQETALGETWDCMPVEQFMNAQVVTVGPNTLLKEVAALLLENHIHRVVVARDEHGKKRPLSVISAADLVYHMVKS